MKHVDVVQQLLLVILLCNCVPSVVSPCLCFFTWDLSQPSLLAMSNENIHLHVFVLLLTRFLHLLSHLSKLFPVDLCHKCWWLRMLVAAYHSTTLLMAHNHYRRINKMVAVYNFPLYLFLCSCSSQSFIFPKAAAAFHRYPFLSFHCIICVVGNIGEFIVIRCCDWDVQLSAGWPIMCWWRR